MADLAHTTALLALLAVAVLAVPCSSTVAAPSLAAAASTGAAAQHNTPAHEDPSGALRQECLSFLRRHLPARDADAISAARMERDADLALTARNATPWAAAVPWPIFLNDVLPHRHLDEPLDEWRPMFWRLFAPLVAQAPSTSAAAQLLNRHIWRLWGIVFRADQAPEILSPSQVIAAGYGSCSALSIFLASACRAVGIPARVAGTPAWVVSGDGGGGGEGGGGRRRRGRAAERFNNHNWVEVWDEGRWSFTGAAEYTPEGLNRTWFFPHPAQSAIPGSRMHAIYAATYARSAAASPAAPNAQPPPSTYFPLAWAPGDRTVPAWDVTQAYLAPAAAAAETATVAAAAGLERLAETR